MQPRSSGIEEGLPPFARFFDDTRRIVLRFLVFRVGPLDAEDCFQETFLSALKAYPQLDPDSNLRAWVLKIAENKAIDMIRKRSRSSGNEIDEPHGEDSYVDHDLWTAVQALPPKQQTAVAYRYIGDLPYKNIAVEMGTSEEAARQNVRAGLKSLRKELVTWT